MKKAWKIGYAAAYVLVAVDLLGSAIIMVRKEIKK